MPEIVRTVNTGPLALETDLTTDLANTNTLIARLTAARAGYLDNLAGGAPFAGVTAQVPLVLPSAADAVAITSGTAPTYGAWVQILAAGSLVACALTGVFVLGFNTIGVDYRGIVDIGVGAAASEVVIARVPYGHVWDSTVGYMGGIYIPISPSVTIAANSRVAARAVGIAASSLHVYAHVTPTPY